PAHDVDDRALLGRALGDVLPGCDEVALQDTGIRLWSYTHVHAMHCVRDPSRSDRRHRCRDVQLRGQLAADGVLRSHSSPAVRRLGAFEWNETCSWKNENGVK